MLTHLSQGLAPPILTVVPLQYFPCCFSLAFLEGYCPSSSLVIISLHLDPMTWDLSAFFKRVASFFSILSQSHWRYSTILFFFSTTLYLSVSSLPSELYTQPNIISLLLQVEARTAASFHVSTTFPATAFLRFQHCFVKYQRG